jgi:hypothetical protein
MDYHIEATNAIEQIREIISRLPVDAWIELKPETIETRYKLIEKAAKAFKRSSYKIKKLALEQTARIEYCRGGNMMTCRGYYCPDPLEDIITKNCRRGRKVKKEPAQLPYYIYHFNNDNELIMVEKKGAVGGIYDKTELLIRFGEFRIGFCYVEKITDTERYIEVWLECKNENEGKYIISNYSVIKQKDRYEISGRQHSTLITFSDGIPRKHISISEWVEMPDILQEILGVGNDVHAIPHEFEVLYDENGIPYAGKMNNLDYLLGNIKQPVLDGMI